MTAQTVMILVISLFAGAVAAGGAWLSVDLMEALGERLAARKEQKRLDAEAKAAKKAEDAANAKK